MSLTLSLMVTSCWWASVVTAFKCSRSVRSRVQRVSASIRSFFVISSRAIAAASLCWWSNDFTSRSSVWPLDSTSWMSESSSCRFSSIAFRRFCSFNLCQAQHECIFLNLFTLVSSSTNRKRVCWSVQCWDNSSAFWSPTSNLFLTSLISSVIELIPPDTSWCICCNYPHTVNQMKITQVCILAYSFE